MSDEPLVSVLCRTRNRPEFLREAVASVAAQTWSRREMVVVNDGGEDVSPVLDPFRDRLEISYLEPGRVYRCRAGNLAMEAARGEWFCFIDDDDIYLPHHIETHMKALAGTEWRFSYSDAWRVEQVRDAAGEWVERERRVGFSEDFSRLSLLRENYIHIVTVCSHRENFAEMGGFDEDLEVLEDHDLWFRYAQRWNFLHVPEVTAMFRIRDDGSNAVTSMPHEWLKTRERLFHRHLPAAMPELMDLVRKGQGTLEGIVGRLLELEARVAKLEGGAVASEGGALERLASLEERLRALETERQRKG